MRPPNMRPAQAQRTFVPPTVDTRVIERAGEAPVYYSIFVPDDYKPSKSVPLVLALHFGGDPEGAGRAVLEILVAQAFQDLGAVIVAPDSKGGSWTSAANERAIDVLMEETMKTYNIDKKKIAITGFSVGAKGEWQYGMKYQDGFSAVIPVSGRPPATTAGWRLPVLAIHSIDDTVQPIRPTQLYIAELKKNGARAELIELSGIAHHQTYRFVDGLRRAVPWLKALWSER